MPLFSPSKDYSVSASSHYHPSAQSLPHSHSHHSSSSHPSSFFFRRRTGKLNWSHLASVSLASIIQHVDVDALQQHVDTITYADITETDLSHATDPQILHLIRLMQLTIEYLINAQNYLIKQAKRRDRLMTEVKAEVNHSKLQLQQRDDEINKLKQDNKYHKRLLKAYETNSNLSPNKPHSLPGGGGGGGGAELSVYTCEYCRASFVSEVYLQGHIGRRHPDAKSRRTGTATGKGKGDGAEEDDEREREREREREKITEKRVRERIEEEERGKRELQRMRDELEADRKRMKEELEREKAEIAKTAEREREAQQAEWQQQRKKQQQQREEEEQKEQFESNNNANTRQPHHINSRPAPILVTAPQPQPQPAALAVEMERVAAEMQQLKEWKDGVMRGDIVISPQPHSANTQPTTHSQHNQRPPLQSTPTLSLSPVSPVPSPSASSSSQQQQQRQQQPRLTSSHRLKRFASFSTFPQLLSHFQHNENDLVRAAEGLEAAMDGWTEEDAERKEEELARAATANGGWERDVAGVEGAVERVMDGFVNEALEERWAAVMEKERELETRKKQREERSRERDTATRRATERLAAERQAMEHAEADRRQRGMIDAVEREREMQRVEHDRQLMAAQQAQLMAAEQMAAHQQLLAHQAAQLSLYSQPAPLQPMIQSQPQQPSMDEQRFLLDKQNALRAAQQLPPTASTTTITAVPYNQQQQQSAALAHAAAAVATQRRGALPPSYNGVEEISDLDSDGDNSPLPAHQQPKQRMEEHKQQLMSSSHLLSPPQPRIHAAADDDDDGVESISLSQPVSPIPHIDDSAQEQSHHQQPQQQKPMQLSAVRRVGGGFMLPAVTAKSTLGGGSGGMGLASGPRPSALKPIDQTRAVVRDLSAELDLEEEEF